MTTKQEYAIKLKSPHWQKKRLEILQRDNFTCRHCDDTEITLHVHHIRYEFGRDPWDYGNENLITLCENCHQHEQEYRNDIRDILDDFSKMGYPAELIFNFLMYGHSVDFQKPE
jgi:5-methylcytosine-specific restriction endonuclease McrA